MTSDAQDAVLLMAYGTPEHQSDVAEYYTHIRGGRRPPDEAIAELQWRYQQVGGGTPLRRITESVRDALQARLADTGDDSQVYVGMKHWHPFIAETLREMYDAGVKRFIALPLAPHYSQLSVGAYRHAVEEAAAALGNPFEMTFVNNWYQQPEFVELIACRVLPALHGMPKDTTVVFTAHSLPVRIREWGDPYERELHESAALVADRLGVRDWRFAWQSAGGSREPWIGPDILEYLNLLRAEGKCSVLQVPIGFVCDHLEILYDIDIEAKNHARDLGLRLERTQLPNASADFIHVLASVVDRARENGNGAQASHAGHA